MLAQRCEREFIHNFNPLSGNYNAAALHKQSSNFKVKLILNNFCYSCTDFGSSLPVKNSRRQEFVFNVSILGVHGEILKKNLVSAFLEA